MVEIMLLRMPVAMLLGAVLGCAARRYIPQPTREVFSIAALLLASLVMPFWMLPMMMDRTEADALVRAAREFSLELTGAGSVICFSTWAPMLRHLLVLEQVGMLARYTVWYGFAPVALCTAWDNSVQATVPRTDGMGPAAEGRLIGSDHFQLSICRPSGKQLKTTG